MDNQVKAFDFEGKQVIDSRDVAKMIGKEHKNLIRDIRHYIKVMGNSSKLSPSNFFIESFYIQSNGKENPCYWLTKHDQQKLIEKNQPSKKTREFKTTCLFFGRNLIRN